jgi:hypothetical protein
MDSFAGPVNAASPSAHNIGRGATTAGEGPGKPVGTEGDRTLSSEGGSQFGGRAKVGDVGLFEGTTSEIGGPGGAFGGPGGPGVTGREPTLKGGAELPGTGSAGPPTVARGGAAAHESS